MKIFIIIVSFNTSDILQQCLETHPDCGLSGACQYLKVSVLSRCEAFYHGAKHRVFLKQMKPRNKNSPIVQLIEY